MTQPDYSTTRDLISVKPDCFDSCTEGLPTLLKTTDNEHKIAEGGLRLKGLYKSNSTEKPLITVITVVYNGVEFLEDTIKSVIEQTYDNVEYIIVDGGSTDGTLEVIRKYEGAIDYWVSEPDKGIYDAMNKGIDLASGDWVNFMNCGDHFYSNNTLVKIPYFSIGSCGLIFGNKCQNGVVIKARPVSDLKVGEIHACHQSMFFSIKVIKRSGIKYDLSYKIYADYDFVARLYKHESDFLFTEEVVSVFQGGGVSSEFSWQKRFDKYRSVFVNFGLNALFFSLLNRVFKCK